MSIERVTADTVLADSDLVFNSVERGVWGRLRCPHARWLLTHPHEKDDDR